MRKQKEKIKSDPNDPSLPPAPLRPRIGVLGPNECDEAQRALGLAVGAGIARRGGILVCEGILVTSTPAEAVELAFSNDWKN